MAKKRSAAERRQSDRLEDVVRTLKHDNTDKANVFTGDWKKLKNQIFSETARGFLDTSLGPVVIFPERIGSQLKLASHYFPIAHGEKYDEKKTIAKYLLIAKEDGDNEFLLPRQSTVLCGLGSTVFHIGLQLAHWLRDSIEFGIRTGKDLAEVGQEELNEFSDQQGLPHGCLGFSQGHWHTDAFEFARLLGPLTSVPWAPRVDLIGCPVSRKHYQDGPSRSQNIIIPEGSRREGHIDVLLMGCTNLDNNGDFFAGQFDDKDLLQLYLEQASSDTRVFIVATADKLGKRFRRDCQLRFTPGDHTSIIVTDSKPPLPRKPEGFRKVI